MTLDRALVTRKAMLILGDMVPLGAIAARGPAAYRANEVDQAVVERRLQRAIGRMVDINYHLVTSIGHAPPVDYHSSFVALAACGVFEDTFARRVARAAGLRNRLVHDYDDLDAGLVFEALQAALQDIPTYLTAVNDYVKRLRPVD
jgi:uncharacterized protein YutE (UPF0331/DUF86 family)